MTCQRRLSDNKSLHRSTTTPSFYTEPSGPAHTHQQKGWKSVNLAHPFSSVSVETGLEAGLSQAENPPPAAGALEFTSPKSATQPIPGFTHHITAQSVLRQAQRILTDPSNVLYNEYSLLPFNKSSQTCIFHCI